MPPANTWPLRTNPRPPRVANLGSRTRSVPSTEPPTPSCRCLGAQNQSRKPPIDILIRAAWISCSTSTLRPPGASSGSRARLSINLSRVRGPVSYFGGKRGFVRRPPPRDSGPCAGPASIRGAIRGRRLFADTRADVSHWRVAARSFAALLTGAAEAAQQFAEIPNVTCAMAEKIGLERSVQVSLAGADTRVSPSRSVSFRRAGPGDVVHSVRAAGCLVTQRPTSVAPATMVAPGWA